MQNNGGRRFLVYLGILLVVATLGWGGYVLAFGREFSMATFTMLVVGAMLILVGTIKPNNQ